jgi:RNA polymerase sigma-70 factor (ECF subfamily)
VYVKSDRNTDAEDRDLVRRTRAGESRAFGCLVGRYQKPVYNVALRISHNPTDAEDIAQTVFLKAFRKLGSFDDEQRFFSWLYRIAINESINFARRRRDHDELEREPATQQDSPEETLVQKDVEEQVGIALMHLKPEDRAIVCLKHFQGFSYQEIGYILDISDKTVKSRLFSARQRLKDVLQRMGSIDL